MPDNETETKIIEIENFKLENGRTLKNVQIAYETAGTLNPEKNNAILIFHALSGSAHITGLNKNFKNKFWQDDCHTGWWDSFVGPKKIIDTEKHFVICQNVLGGCYGTTGPSSINPRTGKEYGKTFPEISVGDMARLQKLTLEKIGINELNAIIGASLGGYIAQEYIMQFGYSVKKAAIVASSSKTSALNKLHGLEQILAIENDPQFFSGNYYGQGKPHKGLMLARMIAHKSYVDIDTIINRAKEETILPDDYFYNYRLMHHIESYMFHQGKKFVKRFDANTYLLITKAIQHFDIAKKYGNGSLEKAFAKSNATNPEYLIASINSDVCFYPEEQKAMVQALEKAGKTPQYFTVDSDKGHDSFLLEQEKYGFLKEFLES
ncbi:MAG: homoserine O-acetyltransferase [Candidatus Diapherotrites archaeon CG11_big_fil_rev_8_21_14_0_20_37_9]|nr:MAG: homoserine O-acetyltransferase [Candidatus Diapherotrites archaeon CG11_big_fil_rev_8_21_14_0_20_37_9]